MYSVDDTVTGKTSFLTHEKGVEIFIPRQYSQGDRTKG